VADCQLAVAYASALERETKRLQTELTRALALGEFGLANEPTNGGELEALQH
jgi:hypothetical protein